MLDINIDGIADFSFASSLPICTQDIPTSGCIWGYYVGVGATSELLGDGYASVLPYGTLIGSNAPPDAGWLGFGYGSPLATFHSSPRTGASRWSGPLGIQGIGYLGVRFLAADGLHYGWIRVRMARADYLPDWSNLEFSPIVMEWAYETRLNTPIIAGATGQESEFEEFNVDFRRPDGTKPTSGGYPSTGRIHLIGNMLRYELHVAGTYASADLRGPAAEHSKAKPAVSLDHPRIALHNSCQLIYDPATSQYVERCGPDFAIFFGEVPLSRPQTIQLRRGALYLSIDGGAVIGQISPGGGN